MPVLLLVGLRMGVMTPTELGAVMVVYSLILSLFVLQEDHVARHPQSAPRVGADHRSP